MAAGRITLVAQTELTFLIARLEAATSRLEDMATLSTEVPQANGLPAAPAVPAAPVAPVTPASSSTPSAPSPPNFAPPTKATEPLPDSIEDFDAFITNVVKKYVNLSDEVGGLVAEQV